MIWQRTELGFKAIVDNEFGGLLYQDEVFRSLHVGDMLKAYIKQVRQDGKIDLSLQRKGFTAATDFAPTLLNYIRSKGGRIQLNDKTPAEEIYATFGVSKKVFKKAVGDLYKKRLIRLDTDGIEAN